MWVSVCYSFFGASTVEEGYKNMSSSLYSPNKYIQYDHLSVFAPDDYTAVILEKQRYTDVKAKFTLWHNGSRKSLGVSQSKDYNCRHKQSLPLEEIRYANIACCH